MWGFLKENNKKDQSNIAWYTKYYYIEWHLCVLLGITAYCHLPINNNEKSDLKIRKGSKQTNIIWNSHCLYEQKLSNIYYFPIFLK